jgi:hypothetical protein
MMDNPLFIDPGHFMFGISRVYLNSEDVTDRKVVWVDLEHQRLCLKAPNEQILKTGDVQGEILEGKIEIEPVPRYKESFQRVCDRFSVLKSYVRDASRPKM